MPEININDAEMLVTVTVPSNYEPTEDEITSWHDTAGNLGYGITFQEV